MISVCMPYFNRQALMDQSIKAYESIYDDLELSICDDRSDPPLEIDTRFDTVLSRIEGSGEPKNPCVPMNRAVEQSSHDVIVLTNPEIEHREDVFTRMLAALENDNDYVIATCRDAHTGRWLCSRSAEKQHKMPKGSGFHFCTILKRDFYPGFDERYRDGQAFEDNDFLWRLNERGANFKMLDDCVVYHYPTRVKWTGRERNMQLLRETWNPA